MRRIESYDEVRALTREGMRSRAETNCFLTETGFRSEIERGTLYLLEWNGGFAFMRRRDGYHIMNMYLKDPSLPMSDPKTITVCEVVSDGKRHRCDELISMLCSCGFSSVLRRIRLTSDKVDKNSASFNIESAYVSDSAVILSLMESCFDPLTGCIPPLWQLTADISAGGVHLIRVNRTIAAVIHTSGNEIRHLCTLPEYRGCGFASALVHSALSNRNNRAMRVWCAERNTAALSLYKTCGFAEDGFASEVMLFGIAGTERGTEKREGTLPAAPSAE